MQRFARNGTVKTGLTSISPDDEISHGFDVPWELLGGVRVGAVAMADIAAMVWPARVEVEE